MGLLGSYIMDKIQQGRANNALNDVVGMLKEAGGLQGSLPSTAIGADPKTGQQVTEKSLGTTEGGLSPKDYLPEDQYKNFTPLYESTDYAEKLARAYQAGVNPNAVATLTPSAPKIPNDLSSYVSNNMDKMVGDNLLHRTMLNIGLASKDPKILYEAVSGVMSGKNNENKEVGPDLGKALVKMRPEIYGDMSPEDAITAASKTPWSAVHNFLTLEKNTGVNAPLPDEIADNLNVKRGTTYAQAEALKKASAEPKDNPFNLFERVKGAKGWDEEKIYNEWVKQEERKISLRIPKIHQTGFPGLVFNNERGNFSWSEIPPQPERQKGATADITDRIAAIKAKTTLETDYARTGQVLKEANQDAKNLLEASSAFKRTNFPAPNKIVALKDEQLGTPQQQQAFGRFKIALLAFSRKYIRVVSGGARSVKELSIQGAKSGDEILKKFDSWKTLEAKVEQAQKELASTDNSYQNQFKELNNIIKGKSNIEVKNTEIPKKIGDFDVEVIDEK